MRNLQRFSRSVLLYNLSFSLYWQLHPRFTLYPYKSLPLLCPFLFVICIYCAVNVMIVSVLATENVISSPNNIISSNII